MPAKRDHPDAPFVEDILDRLAPIAPVTARFMFGGYGLFLDGLMVGLVDDGTLHLKVDDANRAAFEAAGMEPWQYLAKGKAVTMSYYPIPEGDLEDPEALRGWLDGAQAAARRAAVKRSR